MTPTYLEGDYRPWTDLPISGSLFPTFGGSEATWGLIIDHRGSDPHLHKQTKLRAMSISNVLVINALNSPIKEES